MTDLGDANEPGRNELILDPSEFDSNWNYIGPSNESGNEQNGGETQNAFDPRSWNLDHTDVNYLANANDGVSIYDTITFDRIIDNWGRSTGNARAVELNAKQSPSFDEQRELYLIVTNDFWPAAKQAGLINGDVAPPPPPIGITEGPYEIPWTETQEYRDRMQAYENEQARRREQEELNADPYREAQLLTTDDDGDQNGIEVNPADYADDISDRNAANLKATPDGGQISYVQRGRVVLIGGGHAPELQQWVQQGGTGSSNGVITIGKGSVFDPGKLRVTAMGSIVGRAEFEQAIEAISKKRVVWT